MTMSPLRGRLGWPTTKVRIKVRKWKRGRHEKGFGERGRKVDGQKKTLKKKKPFNY